jgi:hypothetical protein
MLDWLLDALGSADVVTVTRLDRLEHLPARLGQHSGENHRQASRVLVAV